MQRTIFLLLASSVFPAYAEDVQNWHWWTNEFDLSKRVSLVIAGQLRTTRPMGEFLQARTGPILRVYVKPKTALVGAYYYRREQNRLEPGWGDSHRFFGGIENYKFLGEAGSRKSVLLETRFLAEHLFGGPAGTLTNYTRLRHRNRVSFREWKVSPLLGYEALTFTNGFWAHRPHGGIRWKASNRFVVDAGYLWDGRSPRAGRQGHRFFTNLLVRFKRMPDPDFPDRPAF